MDDALAVADLADDFGGLGEAADGAGEGDAVEALDHLRSAGAEAEAEASAGHRLQAQRGHADQRGGAGAALDDPGAEADRLGLAGQVGERGDAVVAPGFGRPDGVDTELLGLAGVERGAVPVVDVVAVQTDRDLHEG